ncbi:DEAD/DEAH box helicase [Amnibacterium flavum]|uniref:DNA/RNA helicase n=1 Tax=Amnibacterium flavum TaxID=2173173 RepID=A0A2V1HPP2_9MICO|nr:DEAD/DEAH box helicase [Amnibacterium flavum]PVZ94508.1 DNA/RNA helicase [Amnibacterium flavum]
MPSASWKTAVTAMTDARAASGSRTVSHDFTPMGLLFEVREMGALRDRWRGASAKTADINTPRSADLRLAIRPVTRSVSGNWVRGTVNWSNVGYHTGRLRLNPEHQSWLAQLVALDRSTRGTYGAAEPDWIYLDHIGSPLLWSLFESAAELGMEFVTGKKSTPVTIGHGATLGIEIVSTSEHGNPGDLLVAPAIRIDGERRPTDAVRLLGDHGLYTFTFDPTTVALAPTVEPVTEEQRQLLKSPSTIVVPASDADEFLSQYYPKLRRAVSVTSPDGSVELPEASAPGLVLTATYSPGNMLTLGWHWEYGSERVPLAVSPTVDDEFRDPVAEREVIDALREALGGGVPTALTTLVGVDAAEFSEHVLPRIRETDGVRVDVVGDVPEYRELTGVPALTVTTVETDQRDWFDLGVVVTVDGKKVPFAPLFTALAKGSNKLLLIDGSYLSLRQPVFDQLRELIAEASELDEWETGLRISRYQASLWADFEDLAEETVQAISWRETVAGLRELTGDAPIETTPLPAGLQAEMRPYQRDGYTWLTFLWRHGLGGVLADDMGLGKTLQTLALVAHATETTSGIGRKPFLVVAPTSVVSNWVAEAQRFTPGLAVTGVTRTQRKSGISPAESARGADIVITSYALFRLDFAGYQEVAWAGLILDEAQFVKNATSKAHENAVALDAPFKLAITGTPMENSLTDLWAIFQIVAPGLFPSGRKFAEEYTRPIAAGYGLERLARLRRRIRPLMMRRTKQLVASDLPPKQEQVLHVDLAPAHRKLYDRFLQRERQKLLGLLTDMNKNRFIVFRSLTLLRMLSLDASLVDEQYASMPSAKLDVLLDHLDDVIAEGHRALVFSQFTSFLGKAAERLKAAGIEYEYLDGSTTRRSEVIDRFRGGEAPVFLISLKAGGFGLNLTEADYVFLLDPWWNPAAEEQAIDRTHRIGQTRSVNVYRLVADGTIEEKVMALKEQKARLFDAVIDDDQLFSSTLSADDIRGLLDF